VTPSGADFALMTIENGEWAENGPKVKNVFRWRSNKITIEQIAAR
jgi:hypothetical protein